MADVEVVTIGEVLAVLLADAGLPLGEATRFDLTYAGAEANVAVGLSRLGHRTAFVTRLGDDDPGRRILRELRGEGVDVGAVTLHADRPTGLLMRDTSPTGVSVTYHRAGSAATTLHRDDLPEDLIRSARVLHVSGITAAVAGPDVVRAAIAIARDAGVVVSVDPNIRTRLASVERWGELTHELAGCADVLLIGADDAARVGIEDPIGWGHERGASTVVLKDGARGATESDGRERWHQPALPVTSVDPVGAGDAFAAGWLSGWLRGLEPARRLAEAAAVAACVVATRGDVPGLPGPGRRDALLIGTESVSR